jgi:hypothetical protein
MRSHRFGQSFTEKNSSCENKNHFVMPRAADMAKQHCHASQSIGVAKKFSFRKGLLIK